MRKELSTALIFLTLCTETVALAQPASPAKVAVAPAHMGLITPGTEFSGTVFYPEISEVASEVSGKVDVVLVEEGQKVNAAQELVKLNSDLINKVLMARSLAFEQAEIELEQADADFRLVENSFQEKTVSEQVYDEHRFRVKILGKKKTGYQVDKEAILLERDRKVIRAPFAGVVVERHVNRGEWLQPGAPVMTVARNDVVDVHVDIPEAVLSSIIPGMAVKVKVGGREADGKVLTVIPRGFVSSRTFPLKIRLAPNPALIEGMEATALLPTGEQQQAMLVPGEAVITQRGESRIFVIRAGKAVLLPVRVIGSVGTAVGVEAEEGLEEGSLIAVRGHERLRAGQAVETVE